MNGQGGFGGGGFGGGFSDFSDLGDILGIFLAIFSAEEEAEVGRGHQGQPGNDLQYELHLDFKDAAFGIAKDIKIDRRKM
jgi:molecular chaperone DnaJ